MSCLVPAVVPLAARFDGGRSTTDGGLPWLAQAEQVLGRWAACAAVIPAWRRGAAGAARRRHGRTDHAAAHERAAGQQERHLAARPFP
jgi:hypothetical protein